MPDYMAVIANEAKAFRTRTGLDTHWFSYDTERVGRIGSRDALAICGRWVAEKSFSLDPTCPECAAKVADDAKGCPF